MKILYVENHAVFADTVTRKFLPNHSVTVAPSLADARQALAKGRFDLLLIDFDRAGANAICSKMQFDQIQSVIDRAMRREASS